MVLNKRTDWNEKVWIYLPPKVHQHQHLIRSHRTIDLILYQFVHLYRCTDFLKNKYFSIQVYAKSIATVYVQAWISDKVQPLYHLQFCTMEMYFCKIWNCMRNVLAWKFGINGERKSIKVCNILQGERVLWIPLLPVIL